MNLIKVMVFVLFFSLCLGGRWEEIDRIAVPEGFGLKDYVRALNGDIYLLGAQNCLKIDRKVNQILTVDETPGVLLIPVMRDDVLILKRSGEIRPQGRDVAQLRISLSSLGNPLDAAVFEDSLRRFIVLLLKNRMAIYQEGVEVGSIAMQAKDVALIPRKNYFDNRVPFYTANDNQIYSWQGGDFNRFEGYKSQQLLLLRMLINDLLVAADGSLVVSTPESVLIFNQNGNREDAIGSTKRCLFEKIQVDATLDTLYVYDRFSNQIFVYVRRDKLPANAGPIYLEKNQPNPLETYTDIEFVLMEPLDLSWWSTT